MSQTLQPSPLYATTSEFRNEVWGKRPPNAPINSEQAPEPMSPLTEESESPPPSPRAPSPVPPAHLSVSQTFKEKVPRRTRTENFSYRKCFLNLVIMSSLMALSIVFYNWPSVHSTLSKKWSSIHGTRDYTPASNYNQPTSSFEFSDVAHEGRGTLDRRIKPNMISLVLLQTKFEKVMNDLDIDSFTYNLKHAENDIRDMSQRTQHSSLPNKDPLVEQFYLIISTTKDQVVVANRYILLGVESQGSEVVRNLDGSLNRFAPALLKLGVSGLLQEANATVSDLEELQVQLKFASGMAAQFKEGYTQQRAENKASSLLSPAHLAYYWVNQKALRDFETNFKLLEDICAELERVSTQVKGELSLFHRISSDLHIIHDQLSAATAGTSSD